jgi:hypothetical protein
MSNWGARSQPGAAIIFIRPLPTVSPLLDATYLGSLPLWRGCDEVITAALLSCKPYNSDNRNLTLK